MDFRDEAAQTEEGPPNLPDLKDQEIQTDICESDQTSNSEDNSDAVLNNPIQQSITKRHSCPNIYLMSSCGDNFPEASTSSNLDEKLNFDISQLNYCMETDIVDDFVIL